MVLPGTGKHRRERKEMARSWKDKLWEERRQLRCFFYNKAYSLCMGGNCKSQCCLTKNTAASGGRLMLTSDIHTYSPSTVRFMPRNSWGPTSCFLRSPSKYINMAGRLLSGKFGMQVVEMLFRNLVAGNFTDNCNKCWLSTEHNGILHKHNPYVI